MTTTNQTQDRMCPGCREHVRFSFRWALIMAGFALASLLDPTLVVSSVVLAIGTACLGLDIVWVWGSCRRLRRHKPIGGDRP